MYDKDVRTLPFVLTPQGSCLPVRVRAIQRVDVLASSSLTTYTDRTGSQDVYREFCAQCGSPMFRKMKGWSVLLVAGGTVADTAFDDHSKGKSALHDWQPSQEFLCKNQESWQDIFAGLDRQRNGTPVRR